MAECILLHAGGGGLDPDELTAMAEDVLKGMLAGVAGNDDPVAGTLELTGTAADSQVLNGQTYYNTDAKVKRTGGMTNQGGWTSRIGVNGKAVIPAGYHNGAGYVDQAVTNRGAWTGSVAMNGKVTVPEGYHNGGGYINGPAITNRGAVSQSLNCGGSYAVPEGYHNGSGRVTANSLSSQTSATATAGYLYSGKTAWVNGSKITGNMSVGSVLSFSAAAYGGKKILLKWQNPYAAAGRPFSGVIITYSTSGYPGTGGTQVYRGVGSNSASGGWSQVVTDMPALSTTYYFSLRAYATCSAGDMYTGTANANARTSDALWLTFTSSQSYTIPTGYTQMDLFAVGAGMGSSPGSVGGGGGYTRTVNGVAVSSGQALDIVVGAGVADKAGGESSVSRSGTQLILAYGGGKTTRNGKPAPGTFPPCGGSGGGGNYQKDSPYPGRGGTDGGNGYLSDNVSGAQTLKSGTGQGITTRAWGSSSGTLYSGGGGGGGGLKYSAVGGAGGGGNGGCYNRAGNPGAVNSGGGAGGGAVNSSAMTVGGSGIVLLHVY